MKGFFKCERAKNGQMDFLRFQLEVYPTFPNKNVNEYEIYFYFRLLYKYGILLSKNDGDFFYLGALGNCLNWLNVETFSIV